MGQTLYSRLTEVLKAIDEVGTTDQSVLDMVDQSRKQSSSKLEGDFVFLLSDTIPFVNVPEWFVNLDNRLSESIFWQKQNGDTKMYDSVVEEIDDTREKRYNQVPAVSRK